MSETIAHIKLLQKTDGVRISVRRPNCPVFQLVAVPSTSKATVIGETGNLTEVTIEDWIILRSEWTLTHPPYPMRGDLITVTTDESTKYAVAHPDATTPVYANFNPIDRPPLAWTVHSATVPT